MPINDCLIQPGQLFSLSTLSEVKIGTLVYNLTIQNGLQYNFLGQVPDFAVSRGDMGQGGDKVWEHTVTSLGQSLKWHNERCCLVF